MASTHSNFLTLPPEVKLQICGYVFRGVLVKLSLPPVIIDDSAWNISKDSGLLHRELALLAVRRQLHHECKEAVFKNIVGRVQTHNDLIRYQPESIARGPHSMIYETHALPDFINATVLKSVRHIVIDFNYL